MQKEIQEILLLAKLRVEITKQFSTVNQSLLLDSIQTSNKIPLLEKLQRPLTMVEQQMVLDYCLQWGKVEDILKDRKEIIEQRNQLDIDRLNELEEQRKLVPDEFKEQIERLRNKPSSTKKEVKPVLANTSNENLDNVLPIEIIEKISLLNFEIPVTALIQHIKQKEHNLIEKRICRELEVDELISIRNIEKMLHQHAGSNLIL